MKTCSFCEVSKNKDEFYSRDGHCKECRRSKIKKYNAENKSKISSRRKTKYNKNKDQILKKQKQYNSENKKEVSKRRKVYREKNKEKINKQSKKYWLKNKEILNKKRKDRHKQIKNKKCKVCEIKGDYRKFNIGQSRCKKCQSEYLKKYDKINKKELREKARERQKRRLKNDPKYKLDRNMGSAIHRAILEKKGGKSWESFVEYNIDELFNHIESLFDKNMNWQNYGSYWEVDHIIPKSYFKYEKPEDEEFKLCWSLGNLQPLEKTRNRFKNAKFIG